MEELDIITARIQFVFPTLPKGEKAAAAYLVEHLEIVAGQNLSVISKRIGISKATIIRLCKRIGYEGFLEFRKAVRDSTEIEWGEIAKRQDKADGVTDNIKKVMEEVITRNTEIMRNAFALITEEYDRAVSCMLTARVINMFGNGDAIIPCELMGIKLMKIGIPNWVVNDQDLQLLSASAMRKDDVAIAVSHTGCSKSVVEAMKKARERGAATIGITGAAKSPLLKYCDIVLNTGAIDDITGGDIIARRIAEQTIMETLYLKIMDQMGKTVKDKKMEGAENINRIFKLSDTEGID